jgi:hypothetical protein
MATGRKTPVTGDLRRGKPTAQRQLRVETLESRVLLSVAESLPLTFYPNPSIANQISANISAGPAAIVSLQSSTVEVATPQADAAVSQQTATESALPALPTDSSVAASAVSSTSPVSTVEATDPPLGQDLLLATQLVDSVEPSTNVDPASQGVPSPASSTVPVSQVQPTVPVAVDQPTPATTLAPSRNPDLALPQDVSSLALSSMPTSQVQPGVPVSVDQPTPAARPTTLSTTVDPARPEGVPSPASGSVPVNQVRPGLPALVDQPTPVVATPASSTTVDPVRSEGVPSPTLSSMPVSQVQPGVPAPVDQSAPAATPTPSASVDPARPEGVPSPASGSVPVNQVRPGLPALVDQPTPAATASANAFDTKEGGYVEIYVAPRASSGLPIPVQRLPGYSEDQSGRETRVEEPNQEGLPDDGSVLADEDGQGSPYTGEAGNVDGVPSSTTASYSAEGGMVELAAASHPLQESPSWSETAYTGPTSDVKEVQIDNGVGMFQAFELVASPSETADHPPFVSDATNEGDQPAIHAASFRVSLEASKNLPATEPGWVASVHRSGVATAITIASAVFLVERTLGGQEVQSSFPKRLEAATRVSSPPVHRLA